MIWRRSQKNVYLLKIGDIFKDTESNLAPKAEIIQSKVHFSFRAERHAVKNCRLVYIYIYIYWVDKILFCC